MKKTLVRAFALLLAFLPFLLARPGLAQDRQGLHVTSAELSEWRSRAQNGGPYGSDWDRIVANKNAFLSNPGGDKWGGYDGAGCVPTFANIEPRSKGTRTRDAAFYALVEDDAGVREAVYDALTDQIGEPGADFSVRGTWCLEPGDRLYDINPGFVIAEWATRILFAYDYIRPALSEREKAPIEAWLRDAAYYFRINGDENLTELYSDWEAGVLNGNGRRQAENCDTDYAGDMGRTYQGGPKVCTLGKFYNNRRAHMMRFYALTGIMLGDETAKTWAKRWVKEYIKYHVYPDRSLNELYRGHGKNAALGWSYAFQTYSDVMDVVDHFARNGDMSLYEYTTSEGGGPTAGGNKTAKTPAEFFVATSEGNWRIYNWNTGASPSNLIDGLWHPSSYYAYDTWLAQYNLYWQDAGITSAYLDPGPKNKRGATQPRAPKYDAMGSGKAYPAKLFMFGQLEGEIRPYPNGDPNPDPDPDPNPDPDPDPDPDPADRNLANGSTRIGDSGNYRATSPVSGFWDGDVSGSPSASPGNYAVGQVWVEHDLGQVHELSEARLYGDGEGRWVSDRYTVKVKASAGDPYTTVVDAANASGNQWFTASLDGVEARFVRVEVAGNPSTGDTQAREFAVYGTPADGVDTDGDGSDGDGAFGEAAYYQLAAAHSGKCLDVAAGSNANGANVLQWRCVGAPNQQWQIEAAPGQEDVYHLTARHSSKSLDVAAGSNANGINVQQWRYVGTPNQQWQIEAVSGQEDVYTLAAVHSGKALAVANASVEDDANVQQQESDGGQSNQQWRITPVSGARGATALSSSSAQVDALAQQQTFALGQNRPNPFRSVTNISYHLPKAAEVTIDVYDALGRHVATLANGRQQAGPHTVAFDASKVGSGVYFYRLQAGSFTETKQMTVVK